MIIKKLILENIGLYFGTHEINLNPKSFNNKETPIILFGGLNGSGKTTLFDSIKLCLYGSRIFDKISKKEYEIFLRKKIHASPSVLIPLSHARIGLLFEYSKLGEVHEYQAIRKWELNGSGINEFFFVERDGMPLIDVNKEYWEEFIHELIPIGLSNYFFFDGEKIQNMISKNNSLEFSNSIKSLMGLNLIEKLKADLKIYQNKYLKKLSTTDDKAILNKLEKEIILLEKMKTSNVEEAANLQNEIDPLIEEIKKYDLKVKEAGIEIYKKRDELRKSEQYHRSNIEIIKEKFKHIAEGLLPITISENIALSLEQKLKTQLKLNEDHLNQKALNNKKNEVLKEIEDIKNLDAISEDGYKKIIKSIGEIFSPDCSERNSKSNIDLSENQIYKLLDKIKIAIRKIPNDLIDLSSEYEKQYRKLNEVLTKLDYIPHDELVGPILKKQNHLNQKLGKLLENTKHLDEENLKIKRELEDLNRSREKISIIIKTKLGNDLKINLIEKTTRVLNLYSKEIKNKKIKILEKKFEEIFNILHRKKDLIHEVKINQKNLEIHLYNRKGVEIEKKSLSSGELEIFAISILWALAEMSGQSFPFIIDTPLSRLDSEHRKKLINNFFPFASHQMIILSTNEEINKSYFDNLKSYISKSYLINYNDENETSRIEEKYFWK